MTLTEDQRQARLKWANELETTSIKQCKGMLEDTMGAMCCLGILEHMINPSKGRVGRAFPMPIANRAVGLTPEEEKLFADMNDNLNKNFKEIAGAIRKTVEG